MSRRPRAEPKQRPGHARQLYPFERFKPLDPDKPLAPTRAPQLKAFDRVLPGQGAFDFSEDGPDVVYPEDRPPGHSSP